MNLRHLETSELSAYDDLARRHGVLFNRTDWLLLFGNRMKVLGVFEDGGEMIGGLALYEKRRFGLRVCWPAPFTPTCGPFLAVKATNPVAKLEAHRRVHKCMVAFMEQRHYAIATAGLNRDVPDGMTFSWRGYKVTPHYTFLLDLAATNDALLANMSSDRRKSIRKAERDGLAVEFTTDMEVVMKLVLATFARQDKWVDFEAMKSILFRYANTSNSCAFTTYQGAKPIATVFLVHDHHTAYYVMGGYDAENAHHGAGPAAMFKAICHARDLGLKCFDFEGSSTPSIERYFRGFGGRVTSGLAINKAWLPLEMLLKIGRRDSF